MPFSAMLNGIHAFAAVFFRIERPFGLIRACSQLTKCVVMLIQNWRYAPAATDAPGRDEPVHARA
jgi:hypothetical protein